MQSLKTRNLKVWLIIFFMLRPTVKLLRRSDYCLKFLVLPNELLIDELFLKSIWLSLDYLLEQGM